MPSSCETCSKQDVTLRCSRCRDVYYCDVKCQSKDWKRHKKQCYKFKLGEEVGWRFVKSNSRLTYLNAKVIKLLPNRQYEIRLDYFALRVHENLHKLRQVVKEEKLKAASLKRKKRFDLNKHSDILDLYLQGRDCKKEMESATQGIKECIGSIVHETAQFVSITVMEYLFKPKFKWRISCFWCEEYRVAMKRKSARTRCIEYGAHTLYNTVDDLSIYVFCDECNYKIHYDDMIYGCLNDEHDICLKCAYKKRILPYNNLLDQVIPILMDYVDMNSAREILEYVAGDVIQFK